MSKVGTLLKMILFEDNQLSLTRVVTVVGLLAFLIVSFYLVFTGKVWGNYDTFAVLTSGGSAGNQLVNKFINSKYNSGMGTYRQIR